MDVEGSEESDSDESDDNSEDSSDDSSDDDGRDGGRSSVAGTTEPSTSVPHKRQAIASSSTERSEVAGLCVQVQTLQGQLA